jgi:hypothetical protein
MPDLADSLNKRNFEGPVVLWQCRATASDIRVLCQIGCARRLHPEEIIDYEYRAEHLSTVIARQILEAYYGAARCLLRAAPAAWA